MSGPLLSRFLPFSSLFGSIMSTMCQSVVLFPGTGVDLAQAHFLVKSGWHLINCWLEMEWSPAVISGCCFFFLARGSVHNWEFCRVV